MEIFISIINISSIKYLVYEIYINKFYKDCYQLLKNSTIYGRTKIKNQNLNYTKKSNL
jgi:hypothetical protein